jgi:Tfp pilus assembly protein PilF
MQARIGYDLVAAEKELQKAIQLDPTWSAPHQYLANLYALAPEQRQQGIAELKAAVVLMPPNQAASSFYISLLCRRLKVSLESIKPPSTKSST